MKKKLATVWLGGCSGCHMSLLDIDERILEVVKLADIVKCPIVDGKEFPPVDIALVEGSVTSDEHLQELLHIREVSKVLIALGDCAVTANVTGMRNYLKKEDVLDHAYVKAVSNDQQGKMPGHPALLKLRDKVLPLQEVVHVDYAIPGCPPPADTIFYVLAELLNDRIPNLEQERKLKYG
ncbi:MAG: NADP oxidoreductase [Candidatus Omnitrophica bacterium]|nr:NADP oxidoreductase [Candidatus Omnitrophota bacterium]MDE2214431.1 NADP oxidoreductase [Candidatus Omnitrophota bacterium]MDE2231571.1 NADP oxidoreductase [Candidatus Omnitrophota bacterium]